MIKQLALVAPFLLGQCLMCGRDTALVIGIDKYPKYSDEAKLNFGRTDAVKMAQFLRSSAAGGYELFGPLIGEDAGIQHIRNSLKRIIEVSKQEPIETLFLYFSGHAERDRTGKLYLMAFESDPTALKETAIDMKELRDLVSQVSASSIRIVFDTCSSGDATILSLEQSSNLQKSDDREEFLGGSIFPRERVHVYLSSQAGTRSVEDSVARMGLFTSSFLRGVAGDADGADGTTMDGEITETELGKFLSFQVPKRSLSLTGQAMHPSLINVENSTFVISKYAAATAHQVEQLRDDLRKGLDKAIANSVDDALSIHSAVLQKLSEVDGRTWHLIEDNFSRTLGVAMLKKVNRIEIDGLLNPTFSPDALSIAACTESGNIVVNSTQVLRRRIVKRIPLSSRTLSISQVERCEFSFSANNSSLIVNLHGKSQSSAILVPLSDEMSDTFEFGMRTCAAFYGNMIILVREQTLSLLDSKTMFTMYERPLGKSVRSIATTFSLSYFTIIFMDGTFQTLEVPYSKLDIILKETGSLGPRNVDCISSRSGLVCRLANTLNRLGALTPGRNAYIGEMRNCNWISDTYNIVASAGSDVPWDIMYSCDSSPKILQFVTQTAELTSLTESEVLPEDIVTMQFVSRLSVLVLLKSGSIVRLDASKYGEVSLLSDLGPWEIVSVARGSSKVQIGMIVRNGSDLLPQFHILVWNPADGVRAYPSPEPLVPETYILKKNRLLLGYRSTSYVFELADSESQMPKLIQLPCGVPVAFSSLDQGVICRQTAKGVLVKVDVSSKKQVISYGTEEAPVDLISTAGGVVFGFKSYGARRSGRVTAWMEDNGVLIATNRWAFSGTTSMEGSGYLNNSATLIVATKEGRFEEMDSLTCQTVGARRELNHSGVRLLDGKSGTALIANVKGWAEYFVYLGHAHPSTYKRTMPANLKWWTISDKGDYGIASLNGMIFAWPISAAELARVGLKVSGRKLNLDLCLKYIPQSTCQSLGLN